MCGRPKCLASALAIVPLPLAAAPSTAITSAVRVERRPVSFDAFWSAKARALTGANAYGKARRQTPSGASRATQTYWSLDPHGESRMGRQAHLPQVLDPLLRPWEGRSRALHRMRDRVDTGAGAQV